MSDNRRDFASEPMFYIGFCPQCGTGPLGLRTCGGCDAVVVVCDECDSVWTDDQIDTTPATTGSTTLPCPHCEADLYTAPAHWSTSEEIESTKWIDFAAKAERIVLKSNAPEAGDEDDGQIDESPA